MANFMIHFKLGGYECRCAPNAILGTFGKVVEPHEECAGMYSGLSSRMAGLVICRIDIRNVLKLKLVRPLKGILARNFVKLNMIHNSEKQALLLKHAKSQIK